MAYIPQSSIVAVQSDPTKLQVNASVSGIAGASVIGLPTFQTGNNSVISAIQGSIGAVIIGGSIASAGVANQSVSGRVETLPLSTNASVITVHQGSIGAVIIGGSVAMGAVANQSVSGNVGISGNVTVVSSLAGGIFPISGSVGAVITNTPNVTPNFSSIIAINTGSVVALSQGSVITVHQGSIGAVIIGGSIASAGVANQSVSGTVGANLNSTNASVISVGQGSIAVNIIAGSIAATFTPPANQSVSGTVHVDNFASVISFQLAGSVLATSATVNPAANQSVSGAVTAPAGSVAAVSATQGTTPWVTNFQNSSIIAYQIAGSILATSATITPAANQSVSGTVGASMIGQVTVLSSLAGGIFPISGSVAAVVTNNVTVVSSLAGGIFPVSGSVSAVITNTNVNVSGSVMAILGGSTNASVITVGTAVANQSVSGTVGASTIGTVPTTQAGTWISSVVNTIPSSMLVGASIIGLTPVNISGNVTVVSSLAGGIFPISGSVAATVTNNPLNVAGSVAAIISGSTNSSIITKLQDSSLISINAGSVVTISQGSVINVLQSSSILAVPVGSVIAVNVVTRNDNVASFLGANLTTRYMASDSAGRTLIKPYAAEEVSFSYVGSVVSGSVTLIKASVIGLKNYITDYQIANTGSTTTLVTFQGGDTSIVAFSIAPAGGGSNAMMHMPPNSNTSQDLAFKVSPSQSILYLSVNGFQAP